MWAEMTFRGGSGRRAVLISLAIGVSALGCRARLGGSSAQAASAGPDAGLVTDRCGALSGPLGAAFASVGDHPVPPGVRSSSQWHTDPDAPPFAPPPKDWRTPAGVTFRLVGAPRVERERIIIRGELTNASKTEQRIYVWEAGMGMFPPMLGGSGVARKPIDPARRFPEIYPATSLMVLPAGMHWVWEMAVILPCYTYTPGQAATVYWGFNSIDNAFHGELPVKLPK